MENVALYSNNQEVIMEEYRNIYDSVEAICFNGYNYKEVDDFCGHRLSWNSETMNWAEDNPPADLMIEFIGDDQEPNNVLLPGNFVVRFSSGNYGVVEGYDFLRFFEKVSK